MNTTSALAPRRRAARRVSAQPMRALALVALLVSATQADAQEMCLLHEAAVEQLAGRFGEHAVSRGVTEEGRAIIEVFAGKGGNWTVLRTDVHGRTCVLGSGEGWTPVPLPDRDSGKYRLSRESSAGDGQRRHHSLKIDAREKHLE